MALHLVKLCVGADSIEDLERWRDTIAPGGGPMFHDTRMTPKRKDALLEGGSLYWVIRRVIQCRQEILDLAEYADENGTKRCRIWLNAEIVRTQLQGKRPFQGWRYLKASDAPPDAGASMGGEDLPPDLRRKLIELGAW